MITKEGKAAVHIAAENGHADTLRCLINELKVDVNTQTQTHDTPLHLASAAGRLDIVQWLLQDGNAEVDPIGNEGRTPLHYATEYCHLDIVQYLVKEGMADVNTQSEYWFGNGPIGIAIHRVGSIEEALDGSFSTDVSCKIDTYVEIVRWLVMETESDVDTADEFDLTPLLRASRSGILDIVKCLVIEGKANVNARDSNGQTSVEAASLEGHMEIVQWLLKVGKVDLNNADIWDTGLFHAAKLKGLELFKYLLFEKNVQYDVRHALSSGVSNRQYNVLRCYLDHGSQKGLLVLIRYYLELIRALEMYDVEDSTINQLRERFRETIANASPDELISITSDPKNAFLFYGGDLFKILIKMFNRSFGVKEHSTICYQVQLLQVIYISLQSSASCSLSQRNWLEKALESEHNTLYCDFKTAIRNLLESKNIPNNLGDMPTIAAQIDNRFLKEKDSSWMNAAKTCVKRITCAISCSKSDKSRDDRKELNEGELELETGQDDKFEPQTTTEKSSFSQIVKKLPHMFNCKAMGKIAIISYFMGTIIYLSDLLSDYLVAIDDYSTFSSKLGLFEIILVTFTLIHDNFISTDSLYKTHEEQLRLKLGKYVIDAVDWKDSDLNYSENRFMRIVYKTFWPFKVGKKWSFLCLELPFNAKALLYNILSVLLLRSLVSKLVVLLHEPSSVRVFYRQKTEQSRLKQFYLILEQIPELMIQFYTFQIILNNVSNPSLYGDKYSDCSKIFNYHQFNESDSYETDLLCDILPLSPSSLLSCGIGFRIFSMSVPYFSIPSSILSLEDGFRTLDPLTPNLTSISKILLYACYTFLIPARLFMFGTLLHSVRERSLLIIYMAVRFLTELVINWIIYNRYKHTRKSAQKDPVKGDEERLLNRDEGSSALEEESIGKAKPSVVHENGPIESFWQSVKSTMTVFWWLALFSIRDIFFISIRDPTAYISQVSHVSYNSLRLQRAILWRAMIFFVEGWAGAILIERSYPCGRESDSFMITGWVYLILLLYSLSIILIIPDMLHPSKHGKYPREYFLKKNMVTVTIGFVICAAIAISFFMREARTNTELWIAVSVLICYPLWFGIVILLIYNEKDSNGGCSFNIGFICSVIKKIGSC